MQVDSIRDWPADGRSTGLGRPSMLSGSILCLSWEAITVPEPHLSTGGLKEATRQCDLLVAMIEEKMGHLWRAVPVYERLVSGGRPEPLAAERLAWVRYDQSDFGAAVELLALARGPDDPVVRSLARLAGLPLNIDRVYGCRCGRRGVLVRWCEGCEPVFAPAVRARLMRAKLMRFQRASTRGVSRGPESRLGTPGPSLVSLDPRWARRFWHHRGCLLPRPEREMLSVWLGRDGRAANVGSF